MATSTKQKESTIRVGALVTAAAVVLMVFLFFIGSEQKIFSRKNEYKVRLDTVAGLAEGNPVKISGVTVGVVKDIYLPSDPKKKDVDITLMVARKYADRIRTDSRARMKKLGLLSGDSYIDISPGNPRFDSLEPGSLIPAALQTNVDPLISSGEDLVDNFVQISYSLKNILSRVDRGEGLIGELTSTPETKQRITDTFLATLNKTNSILSHVETGKGLVGKLVYNDKYATHLTSSLASSASAFQTITSTLQQSFESGQGTIPALLSDPDGKKKVVDLIENLRVTSTNLAEFSATLKNGQGLVPRLMNAKQYGDQALAEFTALVHQLNEADMKLNAGQGTAGRLISDPSGYASINDILIGINESQMLRSLIRNRQHKGNEKRDVTAPKSAPPPVTPPPAAAPASVPLSSNGTTQTTSTMPPPKP